MHNIMNKRLILKIKEYNKNLTHTNLKDHRHFDEINLNDFKKSIFLLGNYLLPEN